MERYMGELSNKTDFEFKASLLLLLYNRNISNYYPKVQMFAWEIFCLILGEIDLKLVESKCLEERYRKEKCPSISKSESTQSSIKPIFR